MEDEVAAEGLIEHKNGEEGKEEDEEKKEAEKKEAEKKEDSSNCPVAL